VNIEVSIVLSSKGLSTGCNFQSSMVQFKKKSLAYNKYQGTLNQGKDWNIKDQVNTRIKFKFFWLTITNYMISNQFPQASL